MQDLKESPEGTLDLFDGDTRLSIGGEMIVRTAEDAAELRQALLDETDFDTKYETTAENFAILTRVSQRLCTQARMPLPSALTKNRVISAYTVADQVGGNSGPCGTLQKVAPEDPQPRDAQGKYADRMTLLREEVRRILSDPQVHSSELRKRAAKDAEFGEAWRQELSVPAPAADPFKAKIPAGDAGERGRAQKFADAWTKTPKVKFISGYTVLSDGLSYSEKELSANLELASRFGLIRG